MLAPLNIGIPDAGVHKRDIYILLGLGSGAGPNFCAKIVVALFWVSDHTPIASPLAVLLLHRTTNCGASGPLLLWVFGKILHGVGVNEANAVFTGKIFDKFITTRAVIRKIELMLKIFPANVFFVCMKCQLLFFTLIYNTPFLFFCKIIDMVKAVYS